MKQFMSEQNGNIKCFNEINLRMYHMLSGPLVDAYCDIEEFDAKSWCEEMVNNIIETQLEQWINFMNPENQIFFKTFGIDTFIIYLDLIGEDFVYDTYEDRVAISIDWDNTDKEWIIDTINTLQEVLEEKLNEYGYIEFNIRYDDMLWVQISHST